MRVLGLGLSVPGSGFWVEGLRVSGSGFRVEAKGSVFVIFRNTGNLEKWRVRLCAPCLPRNTFIEPL